MRKILSALALGFAFAASLCVAASACDYMKSSASSQPSAQTAQASTPPSQSNN